MCCFVEGCGNVVKISGVETGDRDTSVSSHVDGVFLSDLGHLFLAKAGVGEHADLACHVTPVVLISEIFKFLFKTFPHSFHAA